MRKIKELELRVVKLEDNNIFTQGFNTETAGRVEKLEKKLAEIDKFLEETILPYIAHQLMKDLSDCLGEVNNGLTNLFKPEKTSKPTTAKNVKKTAEKSAKNVGKKATKKKESDNGKTKTGKLGM